LQVLEDIGLAGRVVCHSRWRHWWGCSACHCCWCCCCCVVDIKA